jgi:hypothetical protein
VSSISSSIKSLEQAGIKLKQRIFHADRGAKAEQDVAEPWIACPTTITSSMTSNYRL